MTDHPDKHCRRSLRLSGYDYAQNGAYFVTVCTRNRESLFGEIEDGNMFINSYGQIVSDVWSHLPDHYFHVQSDQFVVMPNHIHGIIVLNRDVVGAGLKPARTKPHPVALTKCAVRRGHNYGSAIITNISSVMTMIQTAYGNTSSITRRDGRRIGKIRMRDMRRRVKETMRR